MALEVKVTEKQANRLRLEFERGDINAVTYYRSLSGLTREELASKSGVQPRQIFKLEKKRVKFPKHLAKSIADALGIESHRLLDGHDHQ